MYIYIVLSHLAGTQVAQSNVLRAIGGAVSCRVHRCREQYTEAVRGGTQEDLD
jgi:hypothetical protein